MDENVVYDNAQTPTSDPQADQPADPAAVQAESTEGTAPVAEAEATGDEPLPQDPPPPPGGIGAFLADKKKILIGIGILLFVVIIIIILIPKNAAPKTVTLVWWGLWEDSRQIQSLVTDFQQEYPHIKIKYEKQNPQKYRNRLITRITNGQNAPDIFRFHNTWVPMLTQAKVILPLSSDVITPADFKESYYPVMQNDLVVNGAIYGIPMGADTIALFVNTKLLEAQGIQVPRNWDDFVKAANKLTVLDPETGRIKTSGASLGTYGNVTHAPDIIAMLFAQQGANDPAKTVASEADALKFYTSFAKGGMWNSSLDESLLMFGRGNVAMYFGYSWDIFRIQSINKDLQFKTYTVPGLLGKEQSIASYWVEGVSANSLYKEEALLFMSYLAKKESAEKFFQESSKDRAFGEPYARVDLADKLKDNVLIYPFVSQLKNASSSYFVSDTQDGEGGINSLVNAYLANSVNGIVNGNNSPQSAAESLNQGVIQSLSKYGIQ